MISLLVAWTTHHNEKLVVRSKGGPDGEGEESDSGGVPHSHAASHHGECCRGHRLVQEGARRRGEGAQRRSRRQNHARGATHRRFHHHAQRRDDGRQRPPRHWAAHRRRSGSMWKTPTRCSTALSQRAGRSRPAPWGTWRTSSGAIAVELSAIRRALRWTIATRKEDLTPQEIGQRQDAFFKQHAHS